MEAAITVRHEINPHFEDVMFDWDYPTYLLIGGYGSGKSHAMAEKLVIKLWQENRRALVIREVYETIKESCFELILDVLSSMGLLAEYKGHPRRVEYRLSPLQFIFPNGSRIIFRGMDKPQKLKSFHNASIVWLEEGSEIKYEGYKEILGRLRHPTDSLHMLITTNPVDEGNWIYTHFFKRLDDEGDEVIVLDDKRLYQYGTIVKKGTYYHHSTVDDNYFVPPSYIKTLEEIKAYDPDLYRVARLGQFGINGRLVLPQFTVGADADVQATAAKIPKEYHFTGMDFGFEASYNAVVKMAVDDKEKILYIYDEYYRNNMTDDQTVEALERWDKNIRKVPIVADNEDPKAIRFYQVSGFNMRKCKNKYKGSRLGNTRKIKRFKKIICSSACKNTIRELQTLVYSKDRDGNLIYDQFNIDPHTFSAIWYGLDIYQVADEKGRLRSSRRGAA